MIAKAIQFDILWSTFVQYFGKAFQIVIGIIAVKLVTNALDVDEYGIYGKISEYALFFSVAANLGIFGNVVRKMSERPEDGKLFINAMLLRIGTAILFFATGALYAWLFLKDSEFLLGALFFMASLFFDYMTSICGGMLQANYLMGRAVFAQIMGRLANLGIVSLLIHLASTSAPIFFLAPLSASIVTVLLSLLFVRLRIKFTWKIDKKLIWMLFITALPFGIINIVNNLYFRFLPSFFAAKALTDAQFASYNISLHIATTVSLLSTFLMFSTLPAFKRSLRDKHFRRAKTLYKTIQKGLLALALATVVFGTWLTPFAISLVSDKDYFIQELWFILPLMLVLASVSYFYDLVLITLFAFERELWYLKWEFFALLISAIVLISSVLPTDTVTKTLIILTGAIAGESIMVLLGTWRIRKEFAKL